METLPVEVFPVVPVVATPAADGSRKGKVGIINNGEWEGYVNE